MGLRLTHFVFVFGAMVVVGLAWFLASAYPLKEPAHLPPCATEDATNCIWDAKTQGNGEGRSFIDYGGKVYVETH